MVTHKNESIEYERVKDGWVLPSASRCYHRPWQTGETRVRPKTVGHSIGLVLRIVREQDVNISDFYLNMTTIST